jgi:hypothetical protein
MIRVKPGEGLRGGHRREAQRIMVNREGLNSPHVSSDREGNLGDLRHPIRDRIGSRQVVRERKAAGEVTVATKRATERSATD